MTQYLREQERKKQIINQQKQAQLLIKQKEQAMMKSITQIHCRMLRHCLNMERCCMGCTMNPHRDPRYPPVDYFKPRVPGLKVMP